MTDARGSSRFIVVHKSSGAIVGRWTADKPFYTYHHVNAWEEEGKGGCLRLHVDAIAYDQPIGDGGYDEFMLDKLRSNDTRKFQPGHFTRFTLHMPPSPSSAPPAPVCGVRLCTAAVEFPRMDARRQGGRYRFAYAALESAGAVASTGLIKVLLCAHSQNAALFHCITPSDER